MSSDEVKRQDVGSAREELEKARPHLLVARDALAAYITMLQKAPEHLFLALPPLPSGGHAVLGSAIERECSEAVLEVLKKWHAKANRALTH